LQQSYNSSNNKRTWRKEENNGTSEGKEASQKLLFDKATRNKYQARPFDWLF